MWGQFGASQGREAPPEDRGTIPHCEDKLALPPPQRRVREPSLRAISSIGRHRYVYYGEGNLRSLKLQALAMEVLSMNLGGLGCLVRACEIFHKFTLLGISRLPIVTTTGCLACCKLSTSHQRQPNFRPNESHCERIERRGDGECPNQWELDAIP
jgi:hypothetical protein